MALPVTLATASGRGATLPIALPACAEGATWGASTGWPVRSDLPAAWIAPMMAG